MPLACDRYQPRRLFLPISPRQRWRLLCVPTRATLRPCDVMSAQSPDGSRFQTRLASSSNSFDSFRTPLSACCFATCMKPNYATLLLLSLPLYILLLFSYLLYYYYHYYCYYYYYLASSLSILSVNPSTLCIILPLSPTFVASSRVPPSYSAPPRRARPSLQIQALLLSTRVRNISERTRYLRLRIFRVPSRYTLAIAPCVFLFYFSRSFSSSFVLLLRLRCALPRLPYFLSPLSLKKKAFSSARPFFLFLLLFRDTRRARGENMMEDDLEEENRCCFCCCRYSYSYYYYEDAGDDDDDALRIALVMISKSFPSFVSSPN
mmetsp:Transcript_2163/g.7744  ORF Transcript_2163/g.7744 Transcript_2163/m.7744 type:complete len:320 (+) Transcript_2163:153-1112(+)